MGQNLCQGTASRTFLKIPGMWRSQASGASAASGIDNLAFLFLSNPSQCTRTGSSSSSFLEPLAKFTLACFLPCNPAFDCTSWDTMSFQEYLEQLSKCIYMSHQKSFQQRGWRSHRKDKVVGGHKEISKHCSNLINCEVCCCYGNRIG